MTCTALRSRSYPGVRQGRLCGRPVTHLVGPERKPRCKVHAKVHRDRGELVEYVGGETVEATP
jgi:hypothetical protein